MSLCGSHLDRFRINLSTFIYLFERAVPSISHVFAIGLAGSDAVKAELFIGPCLLVSVRCQELLVRELPHLLLSSRSLSRPISSIPQVRLHFLLPGWLLVHS